MNYGMIKPFSIENGPGVRLSLFVSGCTHHCPECFSAETWDFAYGKPFTKETEQEILHLLEPDYMSGLTLLGGDPTEPVNQQALLPLLRQVKALALPRDVWVYSGYVYEQFQPGGAAFCDATAEFLALCDVMVDGPYQKEKRNLMLSYRGSENQRIIDLRKSEQAGQPVLLNFDEKLGRSL